MSDFTTSGVRVIQLNNIGDIYFNNDNKTFVSESKANELNSCNAYPGDIIFAKMMPAGRACVLPEIYKRYLLGSDAIRCKLDLNKCDLFFFLENINRISFRNFIASKTTGSTRKRIGLPELRNLTLLIPEIQEQRKIGKIFSIIEEKLNVTNKIITTLKKYKRGLIQKGLKLLLKSSVQVPFINLFEEQKERNISNFKQYTVGKDGLKKIEETNYELSNHLVFHPNCLLVGIGIDEIAISENITGSVSPVYKVYAIDDFKYVDYCKYYLKPLLWKRKAFITKKSTRREFEIDINELRKMKLPACNNEEFKSLYKIIRLVDNKIDYVTHKYKFLIKLKNYLLQNLFI